MIKTRTSRNSSRFTNNSLRRSRNDRNSSKKGSVGFGDFQNISVDFKDPKIVKNVQLDLTNQSIQQNKQRKTKDVENLLVDSNYEEEQEDEQRASKEYLDTIITPEMEVDEQEQL